MTSELQKIPGVGRAIEQDLINLGFHKVADLKNRDPQEMYDNLCRLQKTKVDRCMLYTFRCAVYYASNKKHDKEKLKWWKWKD